MRKRKTSRTLTGSRIYVRRGKYQYFSSQPILNPKSGKVSKWHILCAEAEGEFKAREVLNTLLDHANIPKGSGDFCHWFNEWRSEIINKRKSDTPKDPVRKEIWQTGTKNLNNVFAVIENAFADFNMYQVAPTDVAKFVDQWQGRRAAQLYRGLLSKFFAWACRYGHATTNPARDVTVEAPKKRKVYITDKQYLDVKAQLLSAPDDQSPGHNESMVAGLMDLYYLMYQRGTDVRLLRTNELDADEIEFTPTKTENSSGATVRVAVTQDMRDVVTKLKKIAKLRSIYLIHDEQGQPLTSRKARDIFAKACNKAGICGITLKDIRAKAATDATKAGYSESQLQTALAHTDGSTTRDYIRNRETPVSEVVLRLPK